MSYSIKCNINGELSVDDLKENSKEYFSSEDFNLKPPCNDCMNVQICINKLKKLENKIFLNILDIVEKQEIINLNKYRVYDRVEKEYLNNNEYYLSPEGQLIFFKVKNCDMVDISRCRIISLYKNNENINSIDFKRFVKERSTGKYDKDGKLIFENDIIRGTFYHAFPQNNFVAQVCWDKDSAGFNFNQWDLSTIEILGNSNKHKIINNSIIEEKSDEDIIKDNSKDIRIINNIGFYETVERKKVKIVSIKYDEYYKRVIAYGLISKEDIRKEWDLNGKHCCGEKYCHLNITKFLEGVETW